MPPHDLQRYLPPELTDYGNVENLTGIFGAFTPGDVLVDENGNVVEVGDGEYDACVLPGGIIVAGDWGGGECHPHNP